MSTTNYPSATPQSQPPKKDSKNLIIGLLAAGILGTWGYFIYDKNKSDQDYTHLQTQYVSVDSARNDLQKSFDASLARLDSLTGYNNELEGKLSGSESEISKLKGQINGILRKQRLTEREKKEAQSLITELNDKISNMEAEIARLTEENSTLTQEKTTLTMQKDSLSIDLATTNSLKEELAKKVDIASTFYATNINITPINEKNGGREKVTSTAKRVDKLVISFDVSNRIAGSGTTNVYVCITGPDGKPIAVEALGSGTFTTRNDGEKYYTAMVPVEFETGKTKPVEFAWKPNSDFQRGTYKIEVYHNGYKIGQATKELKKGGIFG